MTKYYLEGSKIILEKTNNNVLYYIRNEVDDLFSLTMFGMMGYAEHQYDNYFNSPKVCWEVR